MFLALFEYIVDSIKCLSFTLLPQVSTTLTMLSMLLLFEIEDTLYQVEVVRVKIHCRVKRSVHKLTPLVHKYEIL